ncbi:uncharacterized protein CCR75_009399 [Bremia lactucae]|uniref:Uncharacterized protein n=1 Tax=Bremia lactucae TaxID=4779 RepID=A0A976IIU3_BRELC|nr:hypothetical protein CCR75_009399 [Bremia lactucae]
MKFEAPTISRYQYRGSDPAGNSKPLDPTKSGWWSRKALEDENSLLKFATTAASAQQERAASEP